jgi:hypothetical protein
VTNAQLLQVLARALRAAADELERALSSDPPASSPRVPDRPAQPVDELARERARAALRRHGILRT